MSTPPEPFRVLFVCTGNICRSAVAERLLRRELAERLNGDAELIVVESAGVQGLVGEPMDPDSAAALARLGGDSEGFVARRLDADLVRNADLVLTANRKHRGTVVRLDPTAARRAFTMREFARLADQVDLTALPEGDPVDRLDAVVDEVAATRGTIRPDERRDFDIDDPYRGPAALHRRTAEAIAETTEAAAGVLAAAARPELAAEVTDQQVARAGRPPRKAPRRPSSREQRKRRAARRKGALGGLAAVVLLVLLGAAWLGWSGLTAKRELEAAQPLVGDIRAAVLAGDTAAARSNMAALQDHTGTARARTDGPLWGLAERLPWLGDDVTAVRGVTAAVDDVATGILPPLVDVSAALRPENLRASGSRINLEPLEDAAPTLHDAAERSARLHSKVGATQTAGLVAPVAAAVADVRDNVGELATTTRTAARAAELIPPVLGADGKRRYFLAFQNNAEARGTGGLLGAYGLLEADNGRLRVVRLGSANEDLDNNFDELPIDLGADYEALYGRTPPYWVNGNVSPHFPTAGRIWTAMWKEQFGEKVDGVIATDPVALGYMLEATGPARLPGGGRITAANAVALTMQKVYERFPATEDNAVRDAYLQGVAGAVFGKLLSGAGDPKALAEQLAEAAGERRLLVYSTRTEEQRQLEETALAGALPDTKAPFAGLVVNNYSGNKLDYYLDRSLDYRRSACVSADGRSKSRIVVTLTNNAPKGLPPYVDQRLDLASFRDTPPPGSNTEYVEVLATRGAELLGARLDGKELLVTNGQEQGRPAYAFNVTLRPGRPRTVELELSEPASRERPRLMTPQPLVRGMEQHASVEPCGTGA